MDVNIRFKGKIIDPDGHVDDYVEGHLLTNKLATYIVTEKNPHECTQYGYIEIDQYFRVSPETVSIINKP